jgi:hypothetical protein
MAVLIVCLMGIGFMGSGGLVAGGSSAGMSGIAASHRSGIGLWIVDMVILSLICLMVNHAESL